MKLTRKSAAVIIATSLFTAGILFTSCKKEEKTPEPEPTPAPVPQTNTQKLTGKNFKLVALTVDPALFDGNANITDVYNSSLFEPCQKDDLVKFESDGKVISDEGAVKCNTTDPQTSTGTWLWNSTETVITVTQDNTPQSFTVMVNDGTTLKGSTVKNINGTNYTFTYTWTKQ